MKKYSGCCVFIGILAVFIDMPAVLNKKTVIISAEQIIIVRRKKRAYNSGEEARMGTYGKAVGAGEKALYDNRARDNPVRIFKVVIG